MISALKAAVPAPLKRAIRGIISPILNSERAPNSERAGRWVTVDQVQTEITRAKRALSVSQGEWIRALQSFWVKLPPPPADPWSAEYKQHWLSVYESLAGNTYDTSYEANDFDLQAAISKPYPYSTESCEIVGNQLIGIGSLIREMRLPPKASVLEFGPGCGNTSLALAQMGCDVTVIDIESRYVELIESRSKMLNVPVKAINGDFFKVREISESFDAVLFYECFHHCIDHLALLDEIPAKLRPGGRLIFAGETVSEYIPYDWGINPNGEALFQIVTKGWMELGFRESYFVKMLQRKGWDVRKCDSAQTAAAIVYVCTRSNT